MNNDPYLSLSKTEVQKKELFAKVRSENVRVLLGSTVKCGAGMNVQDRLIALHHLDIPWRPSEDGRTWWEHLFILVTLIILYRQQIA